MKVSTHEEAAAMLSSKGALIAADLVPGTNEKEKARRILGLEGLEKKAEGDGGIKQPAVARKSSKLDAFRRQYYQQRRSGTATTPEEQQRQAAKERERKKALEDAKKLVDEATRAEERQNKEARVDVHTCEVLESGIFENAPK
jgi:hypothetical protein